jgi:4-amino-4-deoxy-L-arabinose transferase-like glycosyltransferase
MSAATAAASGQEGRPLLPWIVAAGLCLLAVFSRAPSFAMSVVDWDESLYFIMAEQWRAGHLPYTAVWDNKPIGIYTIFAAFQSIFGDRIFSMRLAALLAVAGTALLIWRIARQLLRDRPPVLAELCAGAAGALFILTSIPDDGIAANTEIFMEAFTCLGLLWALTPVGRIGAMRAVGIGFALGLAFMIKYVAVFDMFAVFAVMLLRPERLGRGLAALGAVIRQGLLFSLGALIPFLAAAALYAASGALPVFVRASLLSNLRRVDVPVSGEGVLGAYDHQIALFPLLYAGLVWLVVEGIRGKPCRRLMLFWVVTSALGVASGGLYFSHYFLQILPVLCVAAGLLLAAAVSLRPALPRVGLLVLALLSLWPLAQAIAPDLGRMVAVARRPPVAGLGLLRDTPARVAADLRPELAAAPGETIYVFDGEPVLYSLTHARLPTRYVFPSFLQSRLLAHMIGIDPMAVLDGIMAERPLFVIRRTNPDDGNAATRNLDVYARMRADLTAGYTVWRRYDTMVVWRRKS